jgi:hypothetical protein
MSSPSFEAESGGSDGVAGEIELAREVLHDLESGESAASDCGEDAAASAASDCAEDAAAGTADGEDAVAMEDAADSEADGAAGDDKPKAQRPRSSETAPCPSSPETGVCEVSSADAAAASPSSAVSADREDLKDSFAGLWTGKFCAFHQNSVIPGRHPDRASSCCAYACARVAQCWVSQEGAHCDQDTLFKRMLDGTFWRAFLRKCVEAWDERGQIAGADVPTELAQALGQGHLQHRTATSGLMGLGKILLQVTARPAVVLCAPLKTSQIVERKRDASIEETGSTFGLYLGPGTLVVDTHPHKDGSKSTGMLVATMPDTEASTIIDFLRRELFPMGGYASDHTIEVTVASTQALEDIDCALEGSAPSGASTA